MRSISAKQAESIAPTLAVDMTERNWLAGQALLAVMQETQETIVATPVDMIKHLLREYGFGLFDFLHVQYRVVDGVYEDAARRAYAYADAMIAEGHRQ